MGALPFVFAATVVGMLLTFDVTDVNRLYAVDLPAQGSAASACRSFCRTWAQRRVHSLVLLAVAAATVRRLHQYGGRRSQSRRHLRVGIAFLPRLDEIYPVPARAWWTSRSPSIA